ncbi:MAG: CpaE family protein [Planctomycetaceae bacterium]
MKFYLVSDDETAASLIRAAILDRGLEFPAGNQCRLAGVSGLIRTVGQSVAAEARQGTAGSESQTTILLVMPDDAERGLEAVGQIHSALPCRLLLVGTIADSRLVLRAMRQGATEYLDQSDLAGELNHALDRIDQRKTRAWTIGVWSACGGAGCSVASVNLACELAKKPGSCGLVDLKVEGGDLATLLNLKVTHTLADASRNVDGLDTTVLRTCLVAHGSGVQLLSASAEYPSFDPVDTRGVQRALSLLGRQVDYLVLDLDRCLSHAAFNVAQSADVLLCVMRPDFVSLRRTKLMLDWLGESGLDRSRVRLVVNRTGSSGELSVAQAAEALEMKSAVDLPDETKAMLRAVNSGEPLQLTAPSVKFSRRLAELGKELRDAAARRQA